MFRKIVETILSKGFTALCNLFTLLITAKYLGAHGRGEMAIFVLGVSIVGIIQNIFSGSILTYLTPNYPIRNLIVLSSMWNILISCTTPFILVYFDLFPAIYIYDLVNLSLILGSITLLQNILLGLEAINKQNIIEITKAFTSTLFLLVFIVIFRFYSIQSVIDALYWSYAITLGVAVICIALHPRRTNNTLFSTRKLVHYFFSFGTQMQLNNISQMINYRFCYYLIEKKIGLSALGIFSVTTSLIEVVWIICKSISAIHYSKSVNLNNTNQRVRLTQQLSKMSLLLTFPAILVLLIIPNDVFSWLFGKDFTNFKPLFISLAPGALLLAVFTLFNHHFSGIGKNMINLKASIVGNIITICVGIATIDSIGMLAGGIATSLGYSGMFIYLLIQFNRMYQLPLNWLRISGREVKTIFDLKEFQL